jgi:hypothetical protein
MWTFSGELVSLSQRPTSTAMRHRGSWRHISTRNADRIFGLYFQNFGNAQLGLELFTAIPPTP